jgi:hypothetical protein
MVVWHLADLRKVLETVRIQIRIKIKIGSGYDHDGRIRNTGEGTV